MHTLKCYMFFNLAIKQRDICIRNIYWKCYIFREILGVSFIFSYIINQKRKKFVNHCPLPILPFSPKLCSCIYIKNFMWMGVLVHGSYLKQKKFTDIKSLGITCLLNYLVRQPVNTPLICQFRGDITISFRCDHALKQLVHGFSLFHFDMAPRLRLGTISRGTWKPWTN